MNHNPITLEALLVLDAIERRGSYAAAAEELDRVPSALSYIVQKLEEQLGVSLFQKQGRRAVLTAAGRHLLKEGRLVLESVNAISDSTRAIATGWEPKLRIAIESVIDLQPVFSSLHRLLVQHPSIEVDVSEEVLNGAWEALIDDRVDVLVGAPGPVPKNRGIHAQKIGLFEPLFVVSPEHPLAAAEEPLTAAQIAEHRTVVVHDSVQYSVARTAGVNQDSQVFYVPSMEYKLRAQLTAIGCGSLPRSTAQPYLDRGELVELQLAEPLPSADLFLAWKLVNRGKGLKKFTELLLAELNA